MLGKRGEAKLNLVLSLDFSVIQQGGLPHHGIPSGDLGLFAFL